MNLLEIVLLIIGALVFVGSFVIPVKKEELQEETIKLAEEEVKKLVAKEMEQAKMKVSELSEDACQEQVQKAERSMERISNEKIMAVNEYSDTVLEEIHKNHQEVVFLYDMLNDKHDTLKSTISEADKNVKDLLQQVKDSEITVKEQVAKEAVKEQVAKEAVKDQVAKEAVKDQVAKESEKETASEELSDEPKPDFKPFKPKKVDVVPKRTRKPVTSKVTEKAPEQKDGNDGEEKKGTIRKESGDLQLQFSSPKKDNGINSNERILELHKAGKSNMAIAKELGLGIGEVKLVIDLYEGMH